MAPFYMTLYWFATVTIALFYTIFDLFDVQNIVTLKSWLKCIYLHSASSRSASNALPLLVSRH